MALSPALDFTASLVPTSSSGPALDFTATLVPTSSLSPALDAELLPIPAQSLSPALDADMQPIFPGLSAAFDHDAQPANVLAQVPSGSKALNPGLNLQILNISPDGVTLGWSSITTADLADDDLVFDAVTDLFGEAGSFPARIFAGGRVVLGYKLHRDNPAPGGFVPQGINAGQGNCLVDEATLTPGTTMYVDNNVQGNQTYAYRLALVVGSGP